MKTSAFPERLKTARTKKGLTQHELAHLLGVSFGAIGNWESGRREPDIDTLYSIALALRVSPAYLAGWTDNMLPEDAEYIQSLGYIHPLEELPEDIAALNSLLREIGWEIIRTNGEYYLGEIGLLSDADIARLKTAAVSALKVTYDMMVKERQKGIIS